MARGQADRHDAAVGAWLDGLIAERPECWRRSMFGHPAFFAQGNLFAVVDGDAVALRLPPGMAEELTDLAYSDFAPNGRPFRHWVRVRPADLPGFPGEVELVEIAIAYARDLPPAQSGRRGPRRGLSG